MAVLLVAGIIAIAAFIGDRRLSTPKDAWRGVTGMWRGRRLSTPRAMWHGVTGMWRRPKDPDL